MPDARHPAPPGDLFYSVVIPAHDEEGCIAETCRTIVERLRAEPVPRFELVVVNDGSTDRTPDILAELERELPEVRRVDNTGPHGFGYAVRAGLAAYRGDAVAIVMGDLSDSPDDIAAYYRELRAGAECVFGSRFVKGGRVIDYPKHKYLLNRLANLFIRILFRHGTNDTTNAFKAYRREVVDGIQPLISPHFNLTVEMPLKAVVRGFTYVKLPISWTNRKTGVSKLKIREMGSRYLYIVLNIWLERRLTRNDYRRRSPASPAVTPPFPSPAGRSPSRQPPSITL